MHEFGLDPLIAEELLLPSFKSKVERRGDSVYVILHFPTMHGKSRRLEQEIDFVIGKHFLITTRYDSIDPLHTFAKVFEVETVLGKEGVSHGGHLFTSMLESLYQALGNECTILNQRLRDIEDQVFNGDERKMVVELSQAGRVIHDFRQTLLPHQEMLTSFEGPAARMFGAEFSYYIRSAQGAYKRVERHLENLRDSLFELRETNNSLLSTKQNEVMKNLTVLAFLFLPLTFIGQLLGMSIPVPLANVPGAFWLVLAGMAVLALSCFIFFKRKGWI